MRYLLAVSLLVAVDAAWEFGKDERNLEDFSQLSGIILPLMKLTRVVIPLQPCQQLKYIRVDVDNWITTPSVTYEKHTRTVVIHYKLLQMALSQYHILARGIRICNGNHVHPNDDPFGPYDQINYLNGKLPQNVGQFGGKIRKPWVVYEQDGQVIQDKDGQYIGIPGGQVIKRGRYEYITIGDVSKHPRIKKRQPSRIQALKWKHHNPTGIYYNSVMKMTTTKRRLVHPTRTVTYNRSRIFDYTTQRRVHPTRTVTYNRSRIFDYTTQRRIHPTRIRNRTIIFEDPQSPRIQRLNWQQKNPRMYNTELGASNRMFGGDQEPPMYTVDQQPPGIKPLKRPNKNKDRLNLEGELE